MKSGNEGGSVNSQPVEEKRKSELCLNQHEKFAQTGSNSVSTFPRLTLTPPIFINYANQKPKTLVKFLLHLHALKGKTSKGKNFRNSRIKGHDPNMTLQWSGESLRNQAPIWAIRSKSWEWCHNSDKVSFKGSSLLRTTQLHKENPSLWPLKTPPMQ